MHVLTTARLPHRCLAACGCGAAYEATYAAGAAAIRPALLTERLAAATGTAPAGTALAAGTAPAETAPSAAATASGMAQGGLAPSPQGGLTSPQGVLAPSPQGGLTAPQGGLTPPEISAAAAALASVGYYEPGLMRLFLEASQATIKEMRLSGGELLSATDDR